MRQRWAMFVMAVWLSGSIWMAIVATQNFYTIDRLIELQPHPAFTEALERLGAAEGRDLLRYLASELNRLFFQAWGILQISIGVLALWLVAPLPDSKRPKWTIVAMLGICIVFAAWITPQIVSVGRSLDFVPRDPMPDGLRTFGLLHAAYTVLDLVKLILGFMVVYWLSRDPE